MDILKSEFQRKNLGFSYHTPGAIYKCQWKWHCSIFITYRLVTAGYTLGIFTAICAENSELRFMAFLTIWTYLMLTIHHVLAALVAVYCYTKNNSSHGETAPLIQSVNESVRGTNFGDTGHIVPDTPWYLKWSWCLAAMVQTTQTTYCIPAYWTGTNPVGRLESSRDLSNLELELVTTESLQNGNVSRRVPNEKIRIVSTTARFLIQLSVEMELYNISGVPNVGGSIHNRNPNFALDERI
ncbi:hypothetical protein ScPMuIL_007672 [Solemya velum]